MRMHQHSNIRIKLIWKLWNRKSRKCHSTSPDLVDITRNKECRKWNVETFIIHQKTTKVTDNRNEKYSLLQIAKYLTIKFKRMLYALCWNSFIFCGFEAFIIFIHCTRPFLPLYLTIHSHCLKLQSKYFQTGKWMNQSVWQWIWSDWTDSL